MRSLSYPEFRAALAPVARPDRAARVAVRRPPPRSPRKG